MKKLLTSRWFHILILLGFLAGAVFVRMQDYPWARSLRFLAFDAYNNLDPRPPTDGVVIVDIDEASLAKEELGQWPWSRLAIAEIVKNLQAMGAKAIVFDIVFAEADRTSPHAIIDRLPEGADGAALQDLLRDMPDNDEVLAEAFRKSGNVVTGFIWTSDVTDRNRKPVLSQAIGTRLAPGIEHTIPPIQGVAANLPALAEAAAGNGNFGVKPEIDGIIRSVPMLFSYADPQNPDKKIIYPSLAVEAVRVAQGAKTIINVRALKAEEAGHLRAPFMMKIGKYEVPMDWDGHLMLHFSKARRADYIPAWTVADGSVDPAKIGGKIVFIGTSAQGLLDLRSSPLDLFISGVEMHVNAVEQIMEGHFLKRPKLLTGVELLSIIFVGLLIIVLAPFIGAIFMALFTAVLVGAITFASWYSYETHGLLLDPVYPSLCIVVLFVMSALLTYVRTEAERRQVRQAFGLYISADFMAELTKDPDKLKLGGETRELTVMFTDIRGFTTIAESMTPAALIQLMNGFLTPMTDLVMSNRGTIDKYMGDAIMAFWNAPLDDPDHVRHACTAALAMNRALDPINAELKAKAEGEGAAPILLKAGIGISTGPASVGNMGSRQRFTYSAIGDSVNLASRLEGQTKNYGASVLVGPETQKRIPEFATLEMDLIRVKGRLEPVRIWALIGDESYAAQPFFGPWRKSHQDMLAAYQAGDFARAEKLTGECRALAGGRLAEFYALYAQRLDDLKRNPPGEWDGVFTATSK